MGAAWAFARHRRNGASIIPLVILSQIVLYVALDGPLFRYRFPYQPLVIVLGAAGLALVLQYVVSVWRDARSSSQAASVTPPIVATGVPHGTPRA